ncbi:MAG: hypothetical protein FD146_9 [Anaerolineaceae bacterium]|nr:MAG: hypothetical protein FD146_9 [Anaerolineaceae bacterium]
MSDYTPTPYTPAPAGPKTSTMAIISLVGGITGITVLPLLGSLAGIIFGHIAKSEIKKSGGMLTGDGMATAGLIMGYAEIGLGLCVICAYVLFMIFAVTSYGYY